MPPLQFSPFGNTQFLSSNGVLAVGYKLFAYLATTTTKTPTYTDIGGGTSHTNPIILNSLGMPPVPIFLDTEEAYKFVLAAATDTDPPSSPLYTADMIKFSPVSADGIVNIADFPTIGDGGSDDLTPIVGKSAIFT